MPSDKSEFSPLPLILTIAGIGAGLLAWHFIYNAMNRQRPANGQRAPNRAPTRATPPQPPAARPPTKVSPELPPPPTPRALPGPSAAIRPPATGFRSIAALADEAARLNTEIGADIAGPPLPTAIANRVFTPELVTAPLARQKRALLALLATMDPLWRANYDAATLEGPAAGFFTNSARFPVRPPGSPDLNYDLVLDPADGTIRIGTPAT